MSKKSHLTILQMNDSHGYIEHHPEVYWKGGEEVYKTAGGYARIASLFKRVRAENPKEVIALDNGDTFHGTFPAVKSKGEALVPLLNEISFDAMTAHWEFAYGPKQFKQLTEQLDYPMVAINCYEENTGKLMFPPYTLLKRNNLRIGVIGIAATIIDKTMPESFSEGIYFTLGNEELPQYIQELKKEENVDLIVVISHLGYPQEIQLAKEVDGIDVLLSGHTHNRIYDPIEVNNTILMQSGSHGSFIGRLDIDVKNQQMVEYNHELLNVSQDITPDRTVKTQVENVMASYKTRLEQVVGHTETALTRNRVMETTMDNLLLQALRYVSNAEMAFSNGWRYGAPITPGPITVNDLWNIIPVNPPVSVCQITGKELWNMMEDNLEHTFSRNPYQQMGGYVKRCLGIHIYFKVENPKGSRIEEFFVGEERLDPHKTYDACFVTTQGIPAKYGSNRKQLNITAIEAIQEYLAEHDPATAELKGTIVPI